MEVVERRDASGGLWIFGYGSLVWRPAFEYAEKEVSFIRGWARRFWQGSTDHRGVPGRPGRVATLLPETDSVCWGVSYRVAPEAEAEVLARLDHRERGGYARHRSTAFHPKGHALSEVLLYVATPENENYLGPAPLDHLARQVVGAHGPSGSNVEYVVELARALREMGADDEHVFTLAGLVEDFRG